ncbi:hypothetical protein L218DRAFT_1007482 [Marasmius fiardii PR-910]|nr:hypothetical protein L218DRAFT_1007482 [Marasmius fiardii PR-910]
MPSFNCLIKQSVRWRSLAFPDGWLLYLSDPLSPFRHLRGRLPNLRDLVLNFQAYRQADSSECPSLNTLHMYGACHTVAWEPSFPWSQIQFLELMNSEYSQVVRIMVLCVNVQQVKLFTVENVYPDEIPATGGTFAELHYLSIDDWRDHADFFQSFTLPSLSTLKIHDLDQSSFWDPDISTQFLFRSSCTITSLSLKLSNFSDLTLITLAIGEYDEWSVETDPQGPSPPNVVITSQKHS